MFNRYWRHYPWYLQLILFILMVFTLMSFGSYIVLALVPRLTGVPLKEFLNINASSSLAQIRAALLTQFISHNFTFLIPALLFAYFTHPQPRQYLGLRPPGRPIHWLLVAGAMIGFLPLVLWLEGFLRHLPMGDWARQAQARNDATIEAFLGLQSGVDFLKVFITMAVVPAVGEEFLFRGLIMRMLHKRSQRMWMPVVLSALMFASVHATPYGLPLIFAAGMLLALIYWYTGSLWCSILAHLVYNGLQVFLVWLSQQNPALKSLTEGDSLPVFLPLAGAALFALCFLALYKRRTPLPANWSQDFEPDEDREIR